MSFPRDVIALLDRTAEVDIETHAPSGRAHRVPIWIVVDGDDVFARSYVGADARWFRELMARPLPDRPRPRLVAPNVTPVGLTALERVLHDECSCRSIDRGRAQASIV